MENERTSAATTVGVRADRFLLVLLGLSLLCNVALGVAFFRISVAAFGKTQPPPASGPAIGSSLPPLQAWRSDGKPEAVEFTGQQPTVVYVFTPTCQWCDRNLDNLKALLTVATRTHRVIGLSLDPTLHDYVEKNELENLPVYVNPSRDTMEAYMFGPTPLTLVISPSGRVLKSWVGAYGGAVKEDVEKYFRLELPGLSR